MYYFNYSYIRTKYTNHAKLLFTDRDSSVYETETNDACQDFYEEKDLFDFCDSPKDSNFFDPVNNKIVGKINDKLKEKIVSEFVVLKSKICSLIDVDNEGNGKTKVVNKNVIKSIRHKNTLMFCLIKRDDMKRSQNKLHSKIFKRNSGNISYTSIPDMDAIINFHNHKITYSKIITKKRIATV